LNGLPKASYAVAKIYQESLKIRDYQNSDYQKLCFFLLKKCADLGMEKAPLPIECVNWAIFLGKNYKELSLEDIELAISLALTNDLYVEENGAFRFADIKNWAWKPLIILCDVLNLYRGYIREKMIPFNRKVAEELTKLEQALENERKFNAYVCSWKERFLKAWEVYSETDVFELKDPYLTFTTKLYSSKLITVSTERVMEIRNEIHGMDIEIPYPDYSGSIASVLKAQKESFKTEFLRCKVFEMVLSEQFKNWKNDKVNVYELINNLNFNINE